MAYQYTRGDLRARLRVEAKLTAVTDPYDDGTLNRTLQSATAHGWEWLTSTDQGFGVRTQTKTVDAADTEGWTPGATSVVLPAAFRRIVEVKRGSGYPDLVSPSEATWRQPSSPPGWYMVSGPGQTTDALTGALVATPQTLDVAPALQAGEEIRLVYAQQPPSLGDPDNIALDTTSLDLVGDGVVRLILARAAVLSLSKEDEDGYERALQEYALAQSEYLRTASQRSGGILRLSRFKRPRGAVR